MRKTVLTFGLISGIIIGVVTFISMSLVDSGTMEPSMLLGYATMVLALSLIFPAVKTYRDKEQGGVIKFGKAFLIGIYISLIASAMYALGWELFISSSGMTAVELMNNMFAGQLEAMKEAGASAEELAQYQIGDWYNNFLPRFLFTMLGEMFWVGVVVSLICAAILKRNKVTPAQA